MSKRYVVSSMLTFVLGSMPGLTIVCGIESQVLSKKGHKRGWEG